MADSSSGDERGNLVPNVQELPLSGIIPAIEEARKRRPPFVPTVGLPNVIRTPQELMVERVMENCAFKSVLAGVVGMKNFHFETISLYFYFIRNTYSDSSLQGAAINRFLSNPFKGSWIALEGERGCHHRETKRWPC